MTELAKKRPEFRNINAFKDLTTYRMTASAWVSILHRVSGAILFLLMPFILWMFDRTVSSEYAYAKFMLVFSTDSQLVGAGGMARGIILKLVVLAVLWAYLHHSIAGMRHLWMDVSHEAVNKKIGQTSAKVVLAISTTLTVILGAKLFGVY